MKINPNKRYNSSQKVAEDRLLIRQNTADRVDLMGRLEDARRKKDAEAMIDVAVEYEWRGGWGDADRARKIRKEAKGMR